MPKVLISDKMSPKAAEIFRTRGIEVDEITGKTPEELKAIIGDYDGLAIRSSTKVTPEILEAADKLFSQIGFDGVSVNDVAVEARVQQGPRPLGGHRAVEQGPHQIEVIGPEGVHPLGLRLGELPVQDTGDHRVVGLVLLPPCGLPEVEYRIACLRRPGARQREHLREADIHVGLGLGFEGLLDFGQGSDYSRRGLAVRARTLVVVVVRDFGFGVAGCLLLPMKPPLWAGWL